MPDEVGPYKQTGADDKQTANQILFERVPKLFGVSIAFTYLVGFLVVAHHLSRFGVSSFSAIQLEYLVAGMWVIAPVALLVFMKKASSRFTDRALSGEGVSWRRRVIVGWIAGIPGSLVIVAAAVFLGSFEGGSWRILALFWVLFVALLSSLDLLWISWNAPKDSKHGWWASRDTAPFYATLLLSIFLIYVLFFAGQVYPSIPYSLGGGKPLRVVFLAEEGHMPDFLLKDKPSRVSAPCTLLAATDKTFVILPADPSQRSIEFKRDAVLGIVVLRESPSHESR